MKAAGIHFVATLMVAAVLAVVTFVQWFPPGLSELAGGVKLFSLLVAGLVACGPLLTALLHRPTKTRRALAVDWALIMFLQSGALMCGMNALVQARPLALVFETDRFRVVTYADIPAQALPDLAQWTRPWGWGTFIMTGIHPAQSEQENWQRLDDMLMDISPSQRPAYWRALAHSSEQIRQRAHPLSDLRAAYPAQQHTIEQATQRITVRAQDSLKSPAEQWIWLPLVSRHSLEWVVFLDPTTLQAKAFVALDGFID